MAHLDQSPATDPKVSIPFYRDVLGMTLVREMHMSDFSNFFFASLNHEDALLFEKCTADGTSVSNLGLDAS